MRPEDLYDLTWASEPRVSPDGKTVAYVVASIDREENAYRGAIWLAAVDGSSPPRQLTAGKKSDGTPRWSPDGTRLAFTSNRDGDKKQLYVLAARGRRADLPHRAEGGRRAAGLVSGRHASRVHVARARRGLRGGGREEAAPAAVHPPPLQARLRRVDRRPANARVRGACGRFVTRGAANGRRLRGRRADVVARLGADRVLLGAGRRLGRAAAPADLGRRRGGRRGATAHARRRALRPALVVAGRLGDRVQLEPGRL